MASLQALYLHFCFNMLVQPTQVFIHQTFIGYLPCVRHCAWCWWYKYEHHRHTHTHRNSTVSSFKESIFLYFINKYIIKDCKMLLWNSETLILNNKCLQQQLYSKDEVYLSLKSRLILFFLWLLLQVLMNTFNFTLRFYGLACPKLLLKILTNR